MKDPPTTSTHGKDVPDRPGRRLFWIATLIPTGCLLWFLGHSCKSFLLSAVGTSPLPRDYWLFILSYLAIAIGMVTAIGASIYTTRQLLKSRQWNRRWFQFSLRMLFALITIIAVPLSWLGYQLHWIRERRAVIQNAYWDQDFQPDGGPPRPPGSLWIFGVKGYSHLWLLEATPQQLEKARRLFPEASVEKAVPLD